MPELHDQTQPCMRAIEHQRSQTGMNKRPTQVHLGFFPSEEYAARAYDRASINKGAKETGGKITTNFEVSDYSEEIDLLRRVSQTDLVAALSTEM